MGKSKQKAKSAVSKVQKPFTGKSEEGQDVNGNEKSAKDADDQAQSSSSHTPSPTDSHIIQESSNAEIGTVDKLISDEPTDLPAGAPG